MSIITKVTVRTHLCHLEPGWIFCYRLMTWVEFFITENETCFWLGIKNALFINNGVNRNMFGAQIHTSVLP